MASYITRTSVKDGQGTIKVPLKGGRKEESRCWGRMDFLLKKHSCVGDECGRECGLLVPSPGHKHNRKQSKC